MNTRPRIQGVVTETVVTEGTSNPHSFWIQGDDGIRYFAHLGDLTTNSGKLLNNQTIDTEFLRRGDRVEFEVWRPNTPKAFHVRRV